MPIQEVTMYAIQCDALGCNINTSELGGDYSAWGDKGGAVEEWTACDGRLTDDGKAYCHDHANRVCPCCDREGDVDFIAEHDQCRACEEKP